MPLIIHKKLTVIIFGVPIGLLGLLYMIFSMIGAADMSSVANSTQQTLQPIVYSIQIDIGIMIGLLAIALAFWFGLGDKLRDFLGSLKKSEVDQKIAMIYNFAQEFRIFRQQNVQAGQLDLIIERILADIRGVGRIKNTIRDEQKENLLVAKTRLLAEMRQGNYNQEANRIEDVFRAHLW